MKILASGHRLAASDRRHRPDHADPGRPGRGRPREDRPADGPRDARDRRPLDGAGDPDRLGRSWSCRSIRADLAAGDVVSMRVAEANAIFTHRIEAVVDRADGRYVRTKGDANAGRPTRRSFTRPPIIGRVELVDPASWATCWPSCRSRPASSSSSGSPRRCSRSPGCSSRSSRSRARIAAAAPSVGARPRPPARRRRADRPARPPAAAGPPAGPGPARARPSWRPAPGRRSSATPQAGPVRASASRSPAAGPSAAAGPLADCGTRIAPSELAQAASGGRPRPGRRAVAADRRRRRRGVDLARPAHRRDHGDEDHHDRHARSADRPLRDRAARPPCRSTWTPTIDAYAAGYEVRRATVSGGPYTTVATVTPRTAASTTNTPPANGTYFYVLRTYFQSWLSANTAEVSAARRPDRERLPGLHGHLERPRHDGRRRRLRVAGGERLRGGTAASRPTRTPGRTPT